MAAVKPNPPDAPDLTELLLVLALGTLAYALYLHMHYDRHPLPAGKH